MTEYRFVSCVGSGAPCSLHEHPIGLQIPEGRCPIPLSDEPCHICRAPSTWTCDGNGNRECDDHGRFDGLAARRAE